MATQVTNGIKISVNTLYRENYSDPCKHNFLFSYVITIENSSGYAVKLLKRHWHVFDSCGEYSEVEGDGVIGEQPVIEPGEIFEYESACNLTTDMGKMHGSFVMERQMDKAQFMVHIPEFYLIAPSRMN